MSAILRLGQVASVSWVVTGGAGYIGSHVVRGMRASGLDVSVLDDLSGGPPDRLPRDVELVCGSITEPADLARIFRGRRVDGVIHLAALKSVGGSVTEPGNYQAVNVDGTRLLLAAMREAGVRQMVFSSSAAVYGRPLAGIVTEQSATRPVNPYGRTKLNGEQLIREAAVPSVMLRQFNVIGAAGFPGAADTGSTNLLPTAFRAMDAGAEPVPVLGDDYDTWDGTAVRDYVHVDDVVRIYLAAVEHLSAGADRRPLVVNVGTGSGHSVREVLEVVGAAAGREVPFRVAPPRTGDVAAIVASTERAARRLRWKAERSFDEAVRSAWTAWPARRVNG